MSRPPAGDALLPDAPDPSAATPAGRRASYLADAPERVRELSAALGRLRVRDPEALGALRRCFDELATSAGSHGLADIASRCVAAGITVAALEHRPLPVPREDLVALERHVLGVAEGFRIAQRHRGDADPS